MTGPPLLEAHKATLFRGATRVFDNLSLRIEQHECVAILGPNGSGKTTLLRAINRELYPVARPDCVFRILGRDRWNVWELRREIGVVSHDLQQRYTASTTAIEVAVSGFFSSIGVHGTLAQQVTSAQLEAARQVLAETGIEAFADTELRHMSTGQQRRLILARALVHRPKTLIFDEPTAGLDLAAGFDYLERLRMLAAAGCNLVIATHHLHELPPAVDRVILLDRGRVVADGSKPQVLTAAALSRVYGVRVRVRELDGYYFAYPGESRAPG